MFGYTKRKMPEYTRKDYESEMTYGNPPNYEGKEHVRYKDPGYSKHNIRYPEDEPHMKSHVTREEEHEAEDDYHMGVPDQTKDTLAKHIKRARMKMDAPDQEDPKPLRGNMVTNTPYRGVEDTSGEEMMGPNDMQEGNEKDMPKEHRKKLIVAVMKKKMKKNRQGSDPGSPPNHMNNMVNASY